VGGGSHNHGYKAADSRVLGFTSYSATETGTVYRLVVGIPGSTFGGSDDPGAAGQTYGVSSESHSHSGTTTTTGSSGTSGGASATTTSGNSGSTSSVGSSTALTVTNPYIDGIPVIKAL